MDCKVCNDDFNEDEQVCGVCPWCVDNYLDNYEYALEYINDNYLDRKFYVEYCFNVENEDYVPGLVYMCKREIDDDIKMHKGYAIDLLKSFLREDLSSYIDWCLKKDGIR